MTATNALEKWQRVHIQHNSKLVIVDDVHAISLSGVWNKEGADDLYPLLFKHAAECKAEVAVFFDPDQAYKTPFPDNFDEELRNLAERIVKKNAGGMAVQDVGIYELKERIRNSREIQRFLQANQKHVNQNASRDFECLNEIEGDRVTYDYIGNNPEDNARHLDAKLTAMEDMYAKGSIIILFDDNKLLSVLKNLMENKYHRKASDGKTFPSEDLAMCRLDDFGGLEGEAVIFVLPPSFGTEDLCYWKYMNVVSSRAKQKLELLLSWDLDKDATPVQREKLDRLLALFFQVSIILKLSCEVTY